MHATFDRPVVGTLHVHLENGETFEATSDDLRQFGLVDAQTEYMRVRAFLRDANILLSQRYGREPSDLSKNYGLNTVRYIVEEILLGRPGETSFDIDAIDEDVRGGVSALYSLERIAFVERDADTAEEFIRQQVADGATPMTGRHTADRYRDAAEYEEHETVRHEFGRSVIVHVNGNMPVQAIDMALTGAVKHHPDEKPTLARWRGRDKDTNKHRIELIYIDGDRL
ncbi:hypothetical protein [Aeromicrobium sp. 179-A 4D2 NHS]|uniref:hypothetical protein n=1 Tax=Aeromicrobium sp. 179-A 4D2 NHS TaxID=3142375 RepID=UPI0039A0B211